MADESGSVWSIARGAAITAIVGGLISWIAGWLPAVWQAIQTAAAWTWSMITLSVPVPLSTLAISATSYRPLTKTSFSQVPDCRIVPSARYSVPCPLRALSLNSPTYFLPLAQV